MKGLWNAGIWNLSKKITEFLNVIESNTEEFEWAVQIITLI